MGATYLLLLACITILSSSGPYLLEATSCFPTPVLDGEHIPTGVQRLFSAFKHAAPVSATRFGWEISPSAKVAIAILDTGADFWHPDFCTNCPLGEPLPLHMDSNLHSGFAAIPTTANFSLWPDPPPSQDDNGHGTHVTGYSPFSVLLHLTTI